MGKKRNFSAKEEDQLQRLKRENQTLKKEVQQLRKKLKQVDPERYQQLQELVEAQEIEDEQATSKSKKEQKLAEQWKCNECDDGVLKLLVINRPDGVFYFRKCNCCAKKTRIKRYHSEVKE